ncbi:hypothetical protein J437_LFUL003921 [Ladona fulva]|uniref:Reverse transcriptase domain-containing protein n=1 Tax=Ladona fulva TaxID=123851 RepID=A0A8K0KAT4_LADFU|nr:hypothetical protein J437_LFUL003921 [Ladona fulva]
MWPVPGRRDIHTPPRAIPNWKKTDWEAANIIPLFKSSDRSSVKSYRPISVLPILAMVCERIILKRISDFTSPYVSQVQHGFLPGCLCLTDLSSLQYHAVETFQSNSQLDVCYVDFAKAFDSLDHSLLLYKLQNRYGIHVWMSSMH